VFDERFIKMDTNQLCELTSAADALDLRSLVDLASRAIARLIEGARRAAAPRRVPRHPRRGGVARLGATQPWCVPPAAGKTPEQIRDLFLLPDDLTEEEKLEPLRTMTGTDQAPRRLARLRSVGKLPAPASPAPRASRLPPLIPAALSDPPLPSQPHPAPPRPLLLRQTTRASAYSTASTRRSGRN
jgi:hypothetical protein